MYFKNNYVLTCVYPSPKLTSSFVLLTESVFELLFGVIGIGMFWYVCLGFTVGFAAGLVIFLGAGVGGIGVEVAGTVMVILFSM